MSGLPTCSRGEIWNLDWNPGSGAPDLRPGIILQSDVGNHAPGGRTTIVVPLSSQERPYLFYVPIPKGRSTGLGFPCWANCTQILTLNTSRLQERLGRVDDASLRQIGMALMDTLDLGGPTRVVPWPLR